MEKSYLVEKHPNYWVPRDAIIFFRLNRDIWGLLNDGGSIMLSEVDFSQVRKYVTIVKVVEEEPVRKPPKKEKSAFHKPHILTLETKDTQSREEKTKED